MFDWKKVKLEDFVELITDYVANGSFASLKANVQIYKEPNYALMVKTADFANDFTKSLTYTDKQGYDYLRKSKLFGGELLLSNIGSVGKVFRVPYFDRLMTLASNSIMIRCKEELQYKWLFYFFLSPIGNQMLNSITTGTTMKKFNKTGLRGLSIPVPSTEEQKRIVAKIEELFSELDNGVETLKKTKQQLAVYRQAVLKEAFDGKYTNSSPLKQASISEIADVGTGATPLTSNSDYYGGEIAWVTSAKINDEKIYIPSEYITEKAIAETNCKVYPPHTLLVAMYGEGKTRGKCAELMISAATNQALAAIELYKNTECFRNYLRWFLVLNYQLIRRKASGGVQPNLNLSIIKNISVPIFNDYDQIKIVEEIERRFSVCDSIERTVDTALQQAEAMRQSILKKAFEGEL